MKPTFLLPLGVTILIGTLSACRADNPTSTEPEPMPPLPPPVAERPVDPGLSGVIDCLATLPVDNRVVGGGVLPDAIPALVDPEFRTISDVGYLQESDLVLGVELHGRFLAFPVKIMNYHEIVNFSIQGDRYAATWCPLAYTYMVFRNPRWKDSDSPRSAAFRVSGGLLDDNLIMFDVETRSTWPQLLGMAVTGARTGDCLKIERNTVMTTWKAWKSLYPTGAVLTDQNESRTRVPSRAYGIDPYAGYHADSGTLHPPTHPDSRLAAKQRILGVHSAESSVALLVEGDIGRGFIGSTPFVIFRDGRSGASFVFESAPAGSALTFVRAGTDSTGLPTFRDRESNSLWSLDGIAFDGTMTGRRLAQLPATPAYWFVWSSLFVGTGLQRH